MTYCHEPSKVSFLTRKVKDSKSKHFDRSFATQKGVAKFKSATTDSLK